MTARQRIEELTNGWYGFALFAGLASILQNGIGLFSLFFTVGSTLFSIVVAWFLGRRLLAKSSLTRLVLVILSALGSVFAVLSVAKHGADFFGSWSLGLLLTIAVSVGWLMMNVRSFRTLTNSSVKGYFA